MDAPRILRHAWGSIEIEGHTTYRDAKLYPGGAREWDWRETGTRHSPGVQRSDIAELLERGASTVVLSRGVQLQLQVAEDVVEWLTRQGISVHVLQTDLAIAKYNDLTTSHVAVGALVHSTC